MSKGKSNRAVKDRMISLYGKKCFIEELRLRTKEEVEADLKKYKKSKRADLMSLTYHHIKERCKGGEASIENGAILRNINHIWFNSLSKSEQARINNLFIKYKNKLNNINNKINLVVAELDGGTGEVVQGTVIDMVDKNKDNFSEEEVLSLPVHDINNIELYKKYIELRRKRQREKWQGYTWGTDNNSNRYNDDDEGR